MSSTAPGIFWNVDPEEEFVAVDLETTGGDPLYDRIIEIGAARFRRGEVVETFATLVNPGRPMPPFVARLTGIDDEMLAGAPSPEEAVRRLKAFSGTSVLLAHNAAFEAAFLGALGFEAPFLDSLFWYELAYPLGPHNLRAAAAAIGETALQQHRALPDAILCGKVFLAALAELRRRDGSLGSALRRLGSSHSPDLSLLLKLGGGEDAGWRRLPASKPCERRPREVPEFPAFRATLGLEPREGQEEMAAQVADCFGSEAILLAEAGTGVGKSLAYLVPGLKRVAEGGRLVVSTYTKALQEQILRKDLAQVARGLGETTVPAAMLKGQQNYLCLLRLRHEEERVAREGGGEERKAIARLVAWAGATPSGDRAEIHVPTEVWERVEVVREACLERRCPFYDECFYFEARRRAEKSPVVLLNHALLVQEAMLEESLLDGAFLVVDEAHELEHAATSALTETLSDDEIGRRLAEARRIAPSGAGELIGRAEVLLGRLKGMLEVLGTRRLTRGSGEGGELGELFAACEDLAVVLAAVADRLRDREEEHAPESLRLVERLSFAARFLAEVAHGRDHGAGMVLWSEVEERGRRVSLKRAPLFVDEALREHLWSRPKAALLTSATLTVAGSFAHAEGRLGLRDDARVRRAIFSSPYRYREQAILGLLEGLPDPADEASYLAGASEAIGELVTAARGRSLVLFTSHRHLRHVAQCLRQRLAGEGIQLFAQGIDGPRRHLVDALAHGPGRVAVFGAQSFWEGIDVPGPRLKLVVIVKLPFRPPDDPVLAARQERLQEEGRSAFLELQLPEAILQLKQGFGRLIRSETDTGAVVVLDPRLTTQRYGRLFLASLPDARVVRAPLEDMVALISAFLGDEEEAP